MMIVMMLANTQPEAGPYFCVSTVGTAVLRSPGHPLGRDLLFYWDLLYLNQTCVVCVCQGGDKEDRQQFPHGSLNQGGERAGWALNRTRGKVLSTGQLSV